MILTLPKGKRGRCYPAVSLGDTAFLGHIDGAPSDLRELSIPRVMGPGNGLRWPRIRGESPIPRSYHKGTTVSGATPTTRRGILR